MESTSPLYVQQMPPNGKVDGDKDRPANISYSDLGLRCQATLQINEKFVTPRHDTGLYIFVSDFPINSVKLCQFFFRIYCLKSLLCVYNHNQQFPNMQYGQ